MATPPGAVRFTPSAGFADTATAVDSEYPIAEFEQTLQPSVSTERNHMSTTLSAATTAAHTVSTHFVGWGPGFGWWFLLIPLFWILVFVLIFGFFGRRWRRNAIENGYGPRGRLNPARQAEVTLAERFAKGDIDEVEYRARLEVLRANAAPTA